MARRRDLRNAHAGGGDVRMIFTESNLVIILILTILDNLCKNSTSCIMQNLHFTTCKKCTLLSHLYGEMWRVQILHIPHFRQVILLRQVPKKENNTQKKRVVFLVFHSFPYLCTCFGRSRRDIYAALGKRYLL